MHSPEKGPQIRSSYIFILVRPSGARDPQMTWIFVKSPVAYVTFGLFVSCLDSLLGYSTWQSQALQLIVLTVFVPRINYLPPVWWSKKWKSSLKGWWVCKFDIMENNFSMVFEYVFTYILMPHNMIILYFHLPYFHVSKMLYVLHSTLVLSYYMGVLLIYYFNGLKRIRRVITPICFSYKYPA